MPCSHTNQGPGRVSAFLFPNGLEGLQEGGLWVPGELSQLERGGPSSPCRERPPRVSGKCLLSWESLSPVNKGLWGPRTIKALPCSQYMFMLAWTVEGTSLGTQFPMRATVSGGCSVSKTTPIPTIMTFYPHLLQHITYSSPGLTPHKFVLRDRDFQALKIIIRRKDLLSIHIYDQRLPASHIWDSFKDDHHQFSQLVPEIMPNVHA